MSDVNADDDLELEAMRKVFSALKDLDTDAQTRVLDYVDKRLGIVANADRQRQSPAKGDNRQTPELAEPSDRSRASQPEDDSAAQTDDNESVLQGISPVAKKWMRRNSMSEQQLSELYSLGVDEIDLVAKNVPGGSAREKLRHVILLQGVASYLSSGVPRVDNEKLREATKHYDADVGGNFASYLKSWASEVAGSRSEANLTLTTRGLNSAKDLIVSMTQNG